MFQHLFVCDVQVSCANRNIVCILEIFKNHDDIKNKKLREFQHFYVTQLKNKCV